MFDYKSLAFTELTSCNLITALNCHQLPYDFPFNQAVSRKTKRIIHAFTYEKNWQNHLDDHVHENISTHC